MAFSDELCFADVTGEGTLASMGPHVGLEVSGLSEFFEAMLVGTN